MANNNFNDPDHSLCQGLNGHVVPIGYLPGSIQSLPLAQVCKGDEIAFLERLHKLPDPRREISD